MNRTFLLLVSVLLAACTNTQLPAEQPNSEPTEETGQTIEQELSWAEKKIAKFIKDEGWTEKNLNLSMEELIEKQKVCYEYAYELYGKGAERIGDRTYRHEHEYSPRFDRCFTRRQIVGRNKQMLIFDVLSTTIMFGMNDDCIQNIDMDLYSIVEIRERCPTEGEIRLLWNALIKK